MTTNITDVLKKDGDRFYVHGDSLILRQLANERWALLYDRGERSGTAVIALDLSAGELAVTLEDMDKSNAKPGDWLAHQLDERANPDLHRLGPAYVAYHSDEEGYYLDEADLS